VKKLTQLVIVGGCVALLAGGAGAAWLLRDRLGDAPKADPQRAEYDALVARLGGNEPAVRDELNDLIGSASAPLDAADQTRVNSLTRECLDPKALLEIGHVQAFLAPALWGEARPFHFVGDAHKARLRAVAGDNPSPEQVLAVRKALARLGAEFALIRQPPDWRVTIEGEAPPLPFLDLLREGPRFLPYTRHPELQPEPLVPAFSGADAELLAQLDLFFNGARARAAFPPDKFPKLYVHGRIPPIPTALGEYTKEIDAACQIEMFTLLPVANPDPEGLENVNDVYSKLDRFLTAVIEFGK
jgi:hypothetical protein